MSNVEFEVDNMKYGTQKVGSSQSRMVNWLMKKGIIKSPQMGNVVLLVVVIINIVIIFAVVKFLL